MSTRYLSRVVPSAFKVKKIFFVEALNLRNPIERMFASIHCNDEIASLQAVAYRNNFHQPHRFAFMVKIQ